MCDEPVRTRVRTPDGWRDFQEYLVVDGAEPAIEEVELAGIDAARPTAEIRGGARERPTRSSSAPPTR